VHSLCRKHLDFDACGGEGAHRWSLLDPLSTLYGKVTHLRNVCYDRQWLKTTWLDVPVISVGNLTTGGTGKTPMVVLLAHLAREAGCQPGVILRGYGGRQGQEADEVMLLRRELPGIPIVACPDRIAGGKQAIVQSAQMLIADDGFQHRRLGRDLDICLVDACFPFGGGKMLPAGRLREPLEGLARADMVILTRCDQVQEETVAQIRSQMREYTNDIPVLTSRHRVKHCVDLQGNILGDLTGRRMFAFAAIGRPESFFNTVRETGADVMGTRCFPDHHRFTTEELAEIRRESADVGADMLICTAKDMVKIDIETAKSAGISPEELAAIEIEITMSDEDLTLLRNKIREVANRVPKREILGHANIRPHA